MQITNASSLRPATSDALTANNSGGTSNADPAGFASLLRQKQMVSTPPLPPAPPTPAPAPAPTPEATGKAPEHPAEDNGTHTASEAHESEPSSTADHARALQKARQRSADGTQATQRGAALTTDNAASADQAGTAGTAAGAATDTAGSTGASQTADPSPASAPIDPTIAQWLATLQRMTPNASGVAPGTAAGTPGTDGAGPSAHLKADLKAEADLKDKAALGPAGFGAAADAVGLNTVMAESRLATAADAQPGTSAGLHAAAPDVAALGAAAGTAASSATGGSAASTPAAATYTIATPVNSPDFAQALGVKLSVLAKDGVQQAELHLNPADMGPVSVQIVMDGTQARVDFGADVAATRHAIEAGLPELASALRDAGFTLAGGGVSQHAGQQAGGNGGNGSDAPGRGARRGLQAQGSDTVGAVSAAARRIVTAGGVDTYA